MISKCFVTAATCLYNQSGTGEMGNLTMTQKLDEAELQSALTALSEWQLSEDGLESGAAIHLWVFNAAFLHEPCGTRCRTRKSSP